MTELVGSVPRLAGIFCWICSLFCCTSGFAEASLHEYRVVVSSTTLHMPEWSRVVETLVEKHHAQVISFEKSIEEILPALRRDFPRFVCFVATPEEATQPFVARIHQLSRLVDDDPYSDFFWGILTGFDAENALTIAAETAPLIVRKSAAGTDIALDMCEQGHWYCELRQNHAVRKSPGQKPQITRGPNDTTKALADLLTEYRAELFVTSGHATERDWQIGFRYHNGTFRSERGQLYGLDTSGGRHLIASPNPKIYLPVGNCLMGHIDSREAMALAFMKSAGVRQMIGYTVPTWYGYAGWGVLDYFVEQPGRFTLTEAVFANHHALTHRLQTNFPNVLRDHDSPREESPALTVLTPAARSAGLTLMDGRGLAFDRDVLAFYGDPAWVARMASQDLPWTQELQQTSDKSTFKVHPNRGDKSFLPISLNGSQRGGRPIIHYFPKRIGEVEVLAGAEHRPVFTDDFILVPRPAANSAIQDLTIVFRSKPVQSSKTSN